jgi:hypothetical protein
MNEKNPSDLFGLITPPLPNFPLPRKAAGANIKGNHFYNGLKYKRVNGKLKVKSERKLGSSLTAGYESYGPAQWKKHGPNPPKNQKNKQDETASKTSS